MRYTAKELETFSARNRRIVATERFKERLRDDKNQETHHYEYNKIAERSSRQEKQQRTKEKSGTTAFTASLRANTAVRLKGAARGLQSANLECVIARGWLYFKLWDYIYELVEENHILNGMVQIQKERATGDEEE